MAPFRQYWQYCRVHTYTHTHTYINKWRGNNQETWKSWWDGCISVAASSSWSDFDFLPSADFSSGFSSINGKAEFSYPPPPSCSLDIQKSLDRALLVSFFPSPSLEFEKSPRLESSLMEINEIDPSREIRVSKRCDFEGNSRETRTSCVPSSIVFGFIFFLNHFHAEWI